MPSAEYQREARAANKANRLKISELESKLLQRDAIITELRSQMEWLKGQLERRPNQGPRAQGHSKEPEKEEDRTLHSPKVMREFMEKMPTNNPNFDFKDDER